MRLQYEADPLGPDGEAAKSTYDESVAIPAHLAGCVASAFYYGGWCWAYAAIPFDGQWDEFKARSEARLQTAGELARHRVKDVRLARVPWRDEPTKLRLGPRSAARRISRTS